MHAIRILRATIVETLNYRCCQGSIIVIMGRPRELLKRLKLMTLVTVDKTHDL